MAFKSLNNKYLTVRKGVVLTVHIDPAIHELDEYFKGSPAVVTSGLRDPAAQLRIIRNELTRRGIAGQYQEAFEDIGFRMPDETYGWQLGWSKLLNLGFIVNPPYTAKVLMDYYRPGSKQNRKGQVIGQSPHTRGSAFDIGGGADGVDNEHKILSKAIGKVKGMKGFLVERNNNAVHVDCKFVDVEEFA